MKKVILKLFIFQIQLLLSAAQISDIQEVYIEAYNKKALLEGQDNKIYLNQDKVIYNQGSAFLKLDENYYALLPSIYEDDFGYFIFINNRNLLEIDEISDKKLKKPEKKWQCPYCYHWYKFGEKCTNLECPTNLWQKNNGNSSINTFRKIF